MNEKKSGSRTLLMSVLMSAPGPLILVLGLRSGHGATQIADLVRRSAELLGLVMAYITFRMTSGLEESQRKQRLEKRSNLFVGAMMCLGGTVMLALAFGGGSEDQGNVITGLIVAAMGLVANTLFWRKYTALHRAKPDPIMEVQARLYGAKSLVDGCVTAALLSVTLLPGTTFSYWLDRIGSAVVAIYLALCGAKTIREQLQKK